MIGSIRPSPVRSGVVVHQAIQHRRALIVGSVVALTATAALSGALPATIASAGFVASAIRYATPLAFGAMAGLWSERSGVVNIGIEGAMLIGAFAGFWGSMVTDSWLAGLVVAMVAGGVTSLILGFLAVTLRSDQVVVGMAINLGALGITSYLLRLAYPGGALAPSVSTVPTVDVGIPLVGAVIDGQNVLSWVVVLVAMTTWIFLFRTAPGLHVRAVGESALTADAAGLSVARLRYASVLLSGVLAALGGAYLSIGFVGTFTENMTEGRGYIALAAVILARWQPSGVLIATFLFGLATASGQRLQGEVGVSASLLATLPYVVTLIVLIGWVGRGRSPADLGRPYRKNQL